MGHDTWRKPWHGLASLLWGVGMLAVLRKTGVSAACISLAYLIDAALNDLHDDLHNGAWFQLHLWQKLYC